MGLSSSRQNSNVETLKVVIAEIQRINQRGKNLEEQKIKVEKFVTFWSVGLFLTVGLYAYFVHRPSARGQRIVFDACYLVYLCIVICSKWLIGRSYEWISTRNKQKLNKLNLQKKNIIQSLVQEEPYRTFLNCFEKMNKNDINKTEQEVIESISEASRRISANKMVLPRKTTIEKCLEFLIGDDDNSRYALICCKCQFHNGMALKEEFEYLSFRCAFCRHYNRAKKRKPMCPILGTDNLPISIRPKKYVLDYSSDNEDDID